MYLWYCGDMAIAPKLRYRVRVIGSKTDYVRRYAVIDTENGNKRVDGVRGGLNLDDATYTAADLNGVDLFADESA